jgi:hypothetical protein
MIKIFSKNSILIHNSPFLTRNVSQKERIKILKQKKSLMALEGVVSWLLLSLLRVAVDGVNTLNFANGKTALC